MVSHKPFTAQRIAQCLGVLDQLHSSGMAAREFAAAHQHNYDQLRAWLRHESHWRAGVQGAPHRPSNKSFAQVHLHTTGLTGQAQARAEQPIRIECTSSEAKRTAVVHFPLADAQVSAHWLATYLSA
jgi:hypothetical protein